ncbi:MAG TPA: molybdopterin-guanine dinucleotide biosynthesis protein B, partial [Bacillota bacterium]|nr:molybdopterin-guanine dinucleotide biosynthesis protein B [Bacillota bacterium]
DTWRHAEAGADTVMIVSPRKMAVISKLETEPELDEVVARIEGVDLVITEGYKGGTKPKIEVFRSAVCEKLFCSPEELIAIASDVQMDVGVPCFRLDDIQGITDLLEKMYLSGNKGVLA